MALVDRSKFVSIEELGLKVDNGIREITSDSDAVAEAVEASYILEDRVVKNTELLDSKEEVTVDDVISSQEALYLALGRLGMPKDRYGVSVEGYMDNRTRLTVSNEGIGKTLSNIWVMIKKIFASIVDKIKFILQQFNMLWLKIVGNISRVDKVFRTLQNKSDIELSDTTKDFFRLKFGHLTDGDPSNLDKTFNAILDTFPSSEIKLFIEDWKLHLEISNVNTQSLYKGLDNGTKELFGSFQDAVIKNMQIEGYYRNVDSSRWCFNNYNAGNLSGFVAVNDGTDINYFTAKLDTSTIKVKPTIKFVTVQNLANTVTRVMNSLFKMERDLYLVRASIIHDSDLEKQLLVATITNNNLTAFTINYLKLWTAKAPSEKMKMLINFSRDIHKFLKMCYKDCAKSSELIYKAFLAWTEKNPTLQNIIPGGEAIKTAGMKYVKNGDMEYISVPTLEGSGYFGGFVMYNDHSNGKFLTDFLEEERDQLLSNDKYTKEQKYVIKDTADTRINAHKAGLIFIEEKPQTNKGTYALGLKFRYYRELGLVINGASEEAGVSGTDYVASLFNDKGKLRADGFAAIKAGIKLKDVARARLTDVMLGLYGNIALTDDEKQANKAVLLLEAPKDSKATDTVVNDDIFDSEYMKQIRAPSNNEELNNYLGRLQDATKDIKSLVNFTWRDTLRYTFKGIK